MIPPQLVYVADRVLNSPGRPGTADNDINAVKNLGVLPGGSTVNHYLTDPDAWFVLTSITEQGEGLKGFQRTAIETSMEPDFSTGNLRFKTRERFSFGWSDWRGCWGSQGAKVKRTHGGVCHSTADRKRGQMAPFFMGVI